MDNYLFKFLDKECYVKEFRSGRIRLMSAYHYATLERLGNLYNNRYDATEGKTLLINNKSAENPLTINFSNNTQMKLGTGVTSVLANSSDPNNQLKLSCFYAIEKDAIPSGKFKTALDTMQGSLGNYYIYFIDPTEFATRVQNHVIKLQAANIVKGFALNHVNYYCIENYSGISSPFSKPDGLSWQREYRLLIETINKPDPFYIDIGDISDITIWGKKDDLYNGYVVNDDTIFIPNHLV